MTAAEYDIKKMDDYLISSFPGSEEDGDSWASLKKELNSEKGIAPPQAASGSNEGPAADAAAGPAAAAGGGTTGAGTTAPSTKRKASSISAGLMASLEERVGDIMATNPGLCFAAPAAFNEAVLTTACSDFLGGEAGQQIQRVIVSMFQCDADSEKRLYGDMRKFSSFAPVDADRLEAFVKGADAIVVTTAT